MFFRRRRWQDEVLRAAAAADRGRMPPPGRRPWLEHGLSNGDTVDCEVCGRTLTVRLERDSMVTVATKDALRGAVMICTECARVLCNSCAAASRGRTHLLTCDRCQGSVALPMSPD